MIAYIEGEVLLKQSNFAIITAGGIGYKIYATSDTLSKLTSPVNLYISHIIREDKDDLYGFESLDEMYFFELLTSISGVGPKSALAIMSLDSMDKLQSAIADGNTNYLTQVSGIGAKTAKKMILELQDKLKSFAGHTQDMDNQDLIDALLVLGFNQREIKEHLRNIPDDLHTDSDKIKYILSNKK